jgi:hypothetical protein
MKTILVRHSLGLAVGLTLIAGCARPSAQSEQPKVASAPAPTAVATPVVVVPAPAPETTPQPAPSAPAPMVATPGTNGQVIQQAIPPSQPGNLPAGITEIVKLAQAGVSEEVLLTYVGQYPGRFQLGSDQIVYLNDLGVSSAVITAMMKHDGTATPAAPAVATAPPVTQTHAVSNVPQTPQPVYTEAPASSPAPPPTTEVSYFYDSLAPYGSWVYLSGYGWCWQPTVAVSVSNWRPYSDRGRWYWSDSGWYWHSDYSWGWAAFHYGRWHHHSRCGWVWTPGMAWGPAWVSWRYTDGYCGWAPLPPEAYWSPGIGFTYRGRGVGVTFEFGLLPHHYTFIGIGDFCDYNPHRRVVHHDRVVHIYHRTTVVNHYGTHENHLVVNRGVGRETIARNSRSEVRTVQVQQAAFAPGGANLGRIDKRGNDLVAYRPQLPKEPPVKPSVVANRMAQNLNQARTTEARPGQPAATSRTATATPATPATPASPNRPTQVQRGTGTPAAPQKPHATTPPIETSRPAPPTATPVRPSPTPTQPTRSTQPEKPKPTERPSTPATVSPTVRPPTAVATPRPSAPVRTTPPENNPVNRSTPARPATPDNRPVARPVQTAPQPTPTATPRRELQGNTPREAVRETGRSVSAPSAVPRHQDQHAGPRSFTPQQSSPTPRSAPSDSGRSGRSEGSRDNSNNNSNNERRGDRR